MLAHNEMRNVIAFYPLSWKHGKVHHMRSDVVTNLSSLFTGEAVNNNENSSNVARPDNASDNTVVEVISRPSATCVGIITSATDADYDISNVN
jgi:hypothetical protein